MPLNYFYDNSEDILKKTSKIDFDSYTNEEIEEARFLFYYLISRFIRVDKYFINKVFYIDLKNKEIHIYVSLYSFLIFNNRSFEIPFE